MLWGTRLWQVYLTIFSTVGPGCSDGTLFYPRGRVATAVDFIIAKVGLHLCTKSTKGADHLIHLHKNLSFREDF